MARSRLCSIPDCGKPEAARGLCAMHYRRLKVWGDTSAEDHRRHDKQLCAIDGCDRPMVARDMCSMHYLRQKRHGATDAPKRPESISDSLRFYRDVVLNYEGDECLFWPFATYESGYARLSLNGRSHFVSRLVCEEANGAPPTTKHEAAHTCGRGHLACVAKNHLTWKTKAENEADKLRHGTSNRGARHGMARLNAAKVKAIRRLEGHHTQKEIAEMFGVTPNHVWRILSRQTWRHLD